MTSERVRGEVAWTWAWSRRMSKDGERKRLGGLKVNNSDAFERRPKGSGDILSPKAGERQETVARDVQTGDEIRYLGESQVL